MSDQKKKSLPKRCTSERLKARRARCWANGQKRKQERRDAQKQRELANRQLRASGQPTAGELKTAKWLENRHLHEQKNLTVGHDTPYVLLRHDMNRHLGGNVTSVDLDVIHRRWTTLGKLAREGVL